MTCLLLFSLICVFVGPLTTTANISPFDQTENIPNRNTPKELVAAWLRFHETGLCQGINATFVFHKNGMEARGVIQDEKSYEKLQKMLLPLRSSYQIDLYLDRPKEEKDSNERTDKDPPASLWENLELRSFLGDRFARARERVGFEDESMDSLPPPDDLLKQRLRIYAEQILDWNGKVERYAKHLPILTRVALDDKVESGLRSRANAAAKAHAREMGRYAKKLNASLEPAFPRSSKRTRTSGPGKGDSVAKTIVERADNVSNFAQNVCVRVYQFIHPEQYTVGLSELIQPSLLESLKSLQKMSSEFQKALAKAK